MAEIRNISNPPARLPEAPARAPARIEAARAAQRAFFQAALNGTPPPAAPAAPVKTAQAAPTDSPPRYGRPGSLVDIKV